MPYNNYFIPEYGPSYRSEDLEIEYKGFKIKKDQEYTLYRIKPPLGKTLHHTLEGGFTRINLAEQCIDQFLKDYPDDQAFETKSVPTHVGRPTQDETKDRRKLELEKRLADLLKEYSE